MPAIPRRFEGKSTLPATLFGICVEALLAELLADAPELERLEARAVAAVRATRKSTMSTVSLQQCVQETVYSHCEATLSTERAELPTAKQGTRR